MKKRTIQRAAGGKKIATVHLQKRLEHDGLVTPPDVIKVPENTQQKSKHWKDSKKMVSGST